MAHDALQIRILLEQFLRNVVGGVAVVVGFDSRLFLEQRHVGVLFLLVRDGSVGHSLWEALVTSATMVV